jgi:hypothetical protein
LAGEPKYSEKIFPSATLSTPNPTWLDPGANPGRRGGKPATNRLSYGVALGTLVHKRFSFGPLVKLIPSTPHNPFVWDPF